ncbi:MAG: bifunctional DNA-formamidopyrimidine glycosylase/DNA-(apurinic or apyrimidinic site) lyase [Phycisphaerales bacterium]
MPELPEIEVIRRALAPVLEGARLRLEHAGPHDMRARGRGRGAARRGAAWIEPAQALDGARVRALHRHGKQLAIEADSGAVLVVQLGMTGQLLATPAARTRTGTGAPAAGEGAARAPRRPRMTHAAPDDPRHDHLAWQVLRAGRATHRLVFRDARRFGGVSGYASMDELRAECWSALGPDGLALDAGALAQRLRGARAVKAALLDQEVVAGVGNIYADEALHRAGIAPTRRARSLRDHELALLAQCIRAVLRSAVAHNGSTLRDYRDPRGGRGRAQLLHAVYGRGGEPCLRCATPLRSARLGGRTTTWCPRCQPAVHTARGRARDGAIPELPSAKKRPPKVRARL